LAAQSQLATARCFVALKRYDQAEHHLRQVVKDSHSNEVSAEAYLLLGDSLKARAKTKEDYERCLLDGYLRVPLLYGGDEKTEARALYEAGRCFQRMAGEENRARADTLFAQLASKYPGNEYAKKVR
jgi:TolA-binding protein